VESGRSLNELNKVAHEESTEAFIKACHGDVLFETTPVNPINGQPAIDHISIGFEQGMHVVTANKGPVVHGYQKLTELARNRNLHFMFESAVMDGAPIFSLFREPLMGARLLGFYGILNSCTNLLLDLMAEGKTLEEAIQYGQSIGITETDPSNDVDGWDASIKVAALSTVLMQHPLIPQEVERTGIRGISPEMIREATLVGEKWKLVCSAGYEQDKFKSRVAPQRVGADSPLYSVNGTSSFVVFKLDVLPGLGILESNPGPETTAFGLLADFLNIVKEVS
jgi:homoserine dehydrogenase